MNATASTVTKGEETKKAVLDYFTAHPGASQRRAAKDLGVSQSLISGYLKGTGLAGSRYNRKSQPPQGAQPEPGRDAYPSFPSVNIIGVAISEIDARLRPASEMRVRLDEEAIASYEGNLDRMPPVTLMLDDQGRHWLIDGAHTITAHKRAGRSDVQAVVKKGSYHDAWREASSANDTHGVRVTNADKRHRVKVALADPEMAKWSDRKLAEWCGVDGKTVAAIRSPAPAEIRSPDQPVPPAVKTIGKDGRARGKPEPRRTRSEPDPARHDPLPGQQDLPAVVEAVEGPPRDEPATIEVELPLDPLLAAEVLCRHFGPERLPALIAVLELGLPAEPPDWPKSPPRDVREAASLMARHYNVSKLIVHLDRAEKAKTGVPA